MSTHYSCAMEPAELARFADEASDNLLQLFDEDGVDLERVVLVYRGMSGIALATAIALELYSKKGAEVMMLFARKEHDNSHGSRIEHTSKALSKLNKYVFVDDFISSGATLIDLIDDITQYDSCAFTGIDYVVLQKAALSARNGRNHRQVWYLAARIPRYWSIASIVDTYSFDNYFTIHAMDHQGIDKPAIDKLKHEGNCYYEE